MIFWRILDNQLHPVKETENLGFEESDGLRIPDEYLNNQEFVVMRTCHGLGDWGILGAMPRLLKQKYPNCKVYLPSSKLLKKLFGQYEQNWGIWGDPFKNVNNIFDNNPYVDGYKDSIEGEVFHDHYRIYDKNNTDVPLVEQMLKFWQFEKDEFKDSQPEVYWTDDEKKLGDDIINEYIGNNEFGSLTITNKLTDRESVGISKKLKEYKFPYVYYTSKPIKDTSFDFVNASLDLRHINFRIQLYIRSLSKINIGNQCGPMDIIPRYSKTYISQRQFPLGSNFIRNVNYL